MNDDYLRSATPLTSSAMGVSAPTYAPLSPKPFGTAGMGAGMSAEPMGGFGGG